MTELGWQAWLTLAVVGGATVTMAREKLGPDLVMFGALSILVVAGVLTPARALEGFAQPAVATIGVLLIVAGAVQETGALKVMGTALLGRSTHPSIALLRIMVPTAIMSAFLNNTPIVAMFIPMVLAHARRIGVHPSKLLIPLSFATMFGGTCTMIGTSANLVVRDMLVHSGGPMLPLFGITWVGVPTTIVGVAYLATVGLRLLPDRVEPMEMAEARDYLVELEVASTSPLVGQTIENAGLRALRGLFLVEIRRRDGTELNPVAPEDQLIAGDHLVFTGLASTVEHLVSQFPGLVPIEEEVTLQDRQLFEVVVSHRSSMVGRTVRDANFRRRYDAAILAVHRAGERIEKKIGDIVLLPGDTLMLSASPGFRRSWANSTEFYLVSSLPAERPQRYRKARLVLAALVVMVLVAGFTGMPLLVAAMGTMVFLVATDCIGLRTARTSVNWTVLVLIGSAFGVSAAMEDTGAARVVASTLLRATEPFGPRATLAAVYLLGVGMASFISNAAAAALVFPVAAMAAQLGHYNVTPFAIAIALAASAGFSTPIGCPPNLLVYGPGGYRYLDFTKVGAPLTALFMALAVWLVPEIWPF
ncbi:MAG: SLC13 family permease [Myxococcota bacterium]